jgi:hypothetical protein
MWKRQHDDLSWLFVVQKGLFNPAAVNFTGGCSGY